MNDLTSWMKRFNAVAQAVTLIGLGVMLAGLVPLAVDHARDWYDDTHPVWVNMTAKDVSRADDAISMRIFGDKVRDCRYLRIYARTNHAEGSVDAYIYRLDMPSMGATRPMGPQSIGIWAVRPVMKGAQSISVFFEHDCNGRNVLTRFGALEVP